MSNGYTLGMTQIALKLPERMVIAVDRLVDQGTYPNRSAAIRSAIETMISDQKERVIDEAFTKGFTAFPETDEELAEATRLAVQSIEDEPWEPWW